MTEMNQCTGSGMLRQLSGISKLCRRALSVALRLEQGEFYSLTARWIMKERYGVSIGHYSYGDCFIPGAFPSGVVVGRYVSIGPGVRVFMRNHPLDRLSMHPFFYNKRLGFVESDTIGTSTLTIGHDTWIGAGTLVLPGCSKIGLGAVIGAGSVVTKNVPDFAVAAGNPARVIKMRFADPMCQKIKESNWWDRTANDCIGYMQHMIIPLGEHHPLLRSEIEQKVSSPAHPPSFT